MIFSRRRRSIIEWFAFLSASLDKGFEELPPVWAEDLLRSMAVCQMEGLFLIADWFWADYSDQVVCAASKISTRCIRVVRPKSLALVDNQLYARARRTFVDQKRNRKFTSGAKSHRHQVTGSNLPLCHRSRPTSVFGDFRFRMYFSRKSWIRARANVSPPTRSNVSK